MANLNSRINKVLLSRFDENDLGFQYYKKLLEEYCGTGLNPKVVSDLETCTDTSFWSVVWEAHLYRFLVRANFALGENANKKSQHGPDFSIQLEDKKVWLEAVVPEPTGIPEEWLAPAIEGELPVVKQKPDKERVLRCSSVILDKKKKLENYHRNGIVGDEDCTVIAVNISKLSRHDMTGTGISQYPLCLEAVLPIGQLAIPLTKQGKIAGPAENWVRHELIKSNGSAVPTDMFLDDRFGRVSAVIQCHKKYESEEGLGMCLIHNPLALNPLPLQQFDVHSEFVCVPEGNGAFLLKEVSR